MVEGKTKKFLFTSAVCLVAVCIACFIWLGIFMNEKTQKAINDIGIIYMSEMSKQQQQKFNAIVELKISQVEGIIRRTPPTTVVYGNEMLEELALSGTIREFLYLGLYTAEGEQESIYGGTIKAYDDQGLKEALKNGGKKALSGYNEQGEKLLLLAVEAQYPMKDGKTSSAMVVGLPMDYLIQALVLDGESSLMYSHIIRRDGSFVIRSGEEYQDNYFIRIREQLRSLNGRGPEEYLHEMQKAMDSNEDYFSMTMVEEGYQYFYCSHLPISDWYLVIVMPYGGLNDTIRGLGILWQHTVIGVCSIILCAVLIIFILYYRLSQSQLRALNKAEKEAVRANKAKSEFLSNMSHDIRTPMNGIVGMTAIAMANIHDHARVQDCLAKITLSSKHLLGLINDVLDMSKIESGKLSLNQHQLSLRDTMESIVNIIQPQIQAKKQHFDIFIRNVIAEEIYCDSVRLNQILINLLSNAIKFTPEEGIINVYLKQEPSPLGDAWVRCHFRVKDNGIGMTREFQEHIFDTFTREKNIQVDKIEGSGLGMAITKYIVEAMKGTIEVNSAPSKGSEFHITIDFEKAVVREEDMILPPWNMLVVDNNEDLCQSAVYELKGIGIEAEWALDGKTAVDMATKRYEQGNSYQIILLDWKMPGMDGLETTREIRKRLGDEIPIFIISAYDWSDIEEEARSVGVHGFISKPLFKSSLYLSLSSYMTENKKEDDKEQRQDIDFTGKRILVAEDNDLNWEIAETLLSETGLELERAENGKVCVEKFENSAEGYFDAILMDIRMPVMTGYDAAVAIRSLKRTDRKLPIIAMTADAFSDDIQRCLDCGMNEHIAKPIDVDQVLEILENYIKI